MKRPSLLAASYAMDWLTGDPEWLPHPVRVLGWTAARVEGALRRLGSGNSFELGAGGLLALTMPAVSMLAAQLVLREAYARHRAFGTAAEVWLASTCLATRNLLDEAGLVVRALDRNDLALARRRLARIVGRDTTYLDESEVCRAVIETLAESFSDGIIAPLFYLALGGVPMAIAYKAVNTLDSMIGHRDQRYLYFGRFAARLDDAANWLPARISALVISLAAGVSQKSSGMRAARIWLRDGSLHASPNAGQVESAMAGALGVRLGGENHYQGEALVSPILGREFPAANRFAAGRALTLVAAASVLGFAALWLCTQRNPHAG